MNPTMLKLMLSCLGDSPVENLDSTGPFSPGDISTPPSNENGLYYTTSRRGLFLNYIIKLYI